MVTPARRGVHWDTHNPAFDFGSPTSDTSSVSVASTSSLHYVNGQLVAHGFTQPPGLCLDGISNSNMDTVVKCLMELLSQRMKDMTRTEQLTTELRTLRYDHERMTSMYKSSSETVANLERELSTQKSRFASSTKSLQQSEAAHKQTTAELQRTRTSLQQVRATHQMELKKKEKEIERMSEKWQKITDVQTKLGATASGLKFKASSSNAMVVEGGAASQMYGKGRGLLETALDDAEKAREQLGKDNLGLKAIILQVANELHRVLDGLKQVRSEDCEDRERPNAFTSMSLFPLVPANFTLETMNNLLADLRRSITPLAISHSSSGQEAPSLPSPELERLQGVIEKLQSELQASQEQAAAQAAETQTMFDRFAADRRLAMGRPARRSGSTDLSVDLMTAPARDEEKERLEEQKRELEEERIHFTEATIRLGKEKAALEAEKVKLDEERRSWQVHVMLADLPPTPEASGSSPSRATSNLKDSVSKSSKSLKKSSSKPAVRVSGTKKTTRVGTTKRRSSSYAVATSPSKGRTLEPAYETEFIPSSSSAPQISTHAASLLPTSFVLPPPSPKASFPAKSSLVLSKPFAISAPSPSPLDTPEEGAFDDALEGQSSTSPGPSSNHPVPQTPEQSETRRFPFPVAKPLASRMIHAYSPAKPSPLSRILMLGNSPPSTARFDGDMSRGLEALMEEVGELDNELGRDSMESMFPEIPKPVHAEETMSLAQQLGVSDSPPESPEAQPTRSESPLREKKVEPNIARGSKKSTTTKGRVLYPEPAPAAKPKSSVLNKAKTRSGPPPVVKSARPVESKIAKEKENTRAAAKSASTTKPAASTSTLRNPPIKLSVGAGRGAGPRRVPIDSAEAPPTGVGRR